jgi:hypothetical protein
MSGTNNTIGLTTMSLQETLTLAKYGSGDTASNTLLKSETDILNYLLKSYQPTNLPVSQQIYNTSQVTGSLDAAKIMVTQLTHAGDSHSVCISSQYNTVGGGGSQSSTSINSYLGGLLLNSSQFCASLLPSSKPNYADSLNITISPAATDSLTSTLINVSSFGKVKFSANSSDSTGIQNLNKLNASLNLSGTSANVSLVLKNQPITATNNNLCSELDGQGATFSGTITNGMLINNPTVTNNGTGYTSAVCKFVDSVGTGASANVSVSTGGISGVQMVNYGSNYTSSTLIVFSGGATATASLGIVGYTVTGNYVLNTNSLSGIGISIIGPNTSAIGNVSVIDNNTKLQVNVVSTGSGYQNSPTVSFTGLNVVSGTATVTPVMGVVSVNIVNAGYYTSANIPTMSFSGGNSSSAAVAPALTLNAQGGIVGPIVISSNGTYYQSVPTVSFTGGKGAVASVTPVNGVLTAVQILTPGSGYQVAPYPVVESYNGPNLNVSSSTGSGASVITAVNGSGAITSVQIQNSGSLYDQSTLSITANNQTQSLPISGSSSYATVPVFSSRFLTSAQTNIVSYVSNQVLLAGASGKPSVNVYYNALSKFSITVNPNQINQVVNGSWQLIYYNSLVKNVYVSTPINGSTTQLNITPAANDTLKYSNASGSVFTSTLIAGTNNASNQILDGANWVTNTYFNGGSNILTSTPASIVNQGLTYNLNITAASNPGYYSTETDFSLDNSNLSSNPVLMQNYSSNSSLNNSHSITINNGTISLSNADKVNVNPITGSGVLGLNSANIQLVTTPEKLTQSMLSDGSINIWNQVPTSRVTDVSKSSSFSNNGNASNTVSVFYRSTDLGFLPNGGIMENSRLVVKDLSYNVKAVVPAANSAANWNTGVTTSQYLAQSQNSVLLKLGTNNQAFTQSNIASFVDSNSAPSGALNIYDIQFSTDLLANTPMYLGTTTANIVDANNVFLAGSTATITLANPTSNKTNLDPIIFDNVDLTQFSNGAKKVRFLLQQKTLNDLTGITTNMLTTSVPISLGYASGNQFLYTQEFSSIDNASSHATLFNYFGKYGSNADNVNVRYQIGLKSGDSFLNNFINIQNNVAIAYNILPLSSASLNAVNFFPKVDSYINLPTRPTPVTTSGLQVTLTNTNMQQIAAINTNNTYIYSGLFSIAPCTISTSLECYSNMQLSIAQSYLVIGISATASPVIYFCNYANGVISNITANQPSLQFSFSYIDMCSMWGKFQYTSDSVNWSDISNNNNDVSKSTQNVKAIDVVYNLQTAYEFIINSNDYLQNGKGYVNYTVNWAAFSNPSTTALTSLNYNVELSLDVNNTKALLTKTSFNASNISNLTDNILQAVNPSQLASPLPVITTATLTLSGSGPYTLSSFNGYTLSMNTLTLQNKRIIQTSVAVYKISETGLGASDQKVFGCAPGDNIYLGNWSNSSGNTNGGIWLKNVTNDKKMNDNYNFSINSDLCYINFYNGANAYLGSSSGGTQLSALSTASVSAPIVLNDPTGNAQPVKLSKFRNNLDYDAQLTQLTGNSNGYIDTITVNTPGAGYLQPPVVFIDDGPGNGQNASATSYLTTSGSVSSILVDNLGSNYISGTSVTIAPPFTPASINNVSVNNGVISDIKLTTVALVNGVVSNGSGFGYDSAPIITIPKAYTSQATLFTEYTSGQIKFSMNSIGGGYANNTTPSFTLNTTALAGTTVQAQLSNITLGNYGRINRITLNNNAGYWGTSATVSVSIPAPLPITARPPTFSIVNGQIVSVSNSSFDLLDPTSFGTGYRSNLTAANLPTSSTTGLVNLTFDSPIQTRALVGSFGYNSSIPYTTTQASGDNGLRLLTSATLSNVGAGYYGTNVKLTIPAITAIPFNVTFLTTASNTSGAGKIVPQITNPGAGFPVTALGTHMLTYTGGSFNNVQEATPYIIVTIGTVNIVGGSSFIGVTDVVVNNNLWNKISDGYFDTPTSYNVSGINSKLSTNAVPVQQLSLNVSNGTITTVDNKVDFTSFKALIVPGTILTISDPPIAMPAYGTCNILQLSPIDGQNCCLGTNIVMTSSGNGYTSTPSCQFDAPSNPSVGGKQAAIVFNDLTFDNGVLSFRNADINVLGGGYTTSMFLGANPPLSLTISKPNFVLPTLSLILYKNANSVTNTITDYGLAISGATTSGNGFTPAMYYAATGTTGLTQAYASSVVIDAPLNTQAKYTSIISAQIRPTDLSGVVNSLTSGTSGVGTSPTNTQGTGYTSDQFNTMNSLAAGSVPQLTITISSPTRTLATATATPNFVNYIGTFGSKISYYITRTQGSAVLSYTNGSTTFVSNSQPLANSAQLIVSSLQNGSINLGQMGLKIILNNSLYTTFSGSKTYTLTLNPDNFTASFSSSVLSNSVLAALTAAYIPVASGKVTNYNLTNFPSGTIVATRVFSNKNINFSFTVDPSQSILYYSPSYIKPDPAFTYVQGALNGNGVPDPNISAYSGGQPVATITSLNNAFGGLTFNLNNTFSSSYGSYTYGGNTIYSNPNVMFFQTANSQVVVSYPAVDSTNDTLSNITYNSVAFDAVSGITSGGTNTFAKPTNLDALSITYVPSNGVTKANLLSNPYTRQSIVPNAYLISVKMGANATNKTVLSNVQLNESAINSASVSTAPVSVALLNNVFNFSLKQPAGSVGGTNYVITDTNIFFNIPQFLLPSTQDYVLPFSMTLSGGTPMGQVRFYTISYNENSTPTIVFHRYTCQNDPLLALADYPRTIGNTTTQLSSNIYNLSASAHETYNLPVQSMTTAGTSAYNINNGGIITLASQLQLSLSQLNGSNISWASDSSYSSGIVGSVTGLSLDGVISYRNSLQVGNSNYVSVISSLIPDVTFMTNAAGYPVYRVAANGAVTIYQNLNRVVSAQ